MPESNVKIMVSPTEFFREQVGQALNKQKVNVSEEIEFYLVNLMMDFINPAKVSAVLGEKNVFDIPLAFIFKAALEAPTEEKVRYYKVLGDTSLYFSGFFQDYFNNKTYDVDYYIMLGSSAYNAVSTIVKDSPRVSNQANTYRYLSQDFAKLVEVVAEIRDHLEPSQSVDLLATYDRFLKNNSERLRKKLEEYGITPIPYKSKNIQ